jgi:hypothetical protein
MAMTWLSPLVDGVIGVDLAFNGDVLKASCVDPPLART